MGEIRFPIPHFPRALQAYDPLEEASFRASVERALTGTMPNLGGVQETIIVPHTGLLPASPTADEWSCTTTSITPLNTADEIVLFYPIAHPVDTVVSEIRARLYRNTSSDTATVEVLGGTELSMTSLGSAAHDSTDWQTITVTGAPLLTVAAATKYIVKVTLRGAAAAVDAALGHLEIDLSSTYYKHIRS